MSATRVLVNGPPLAAHVRSQFQRPQSPDDEGSWPVAYLVTWRTYGTWLPGDPRGSTIRRADKSEARVEAHPLWEMSARQRLKHAPVLLTASQRLLVERTIEATAAHAGWSVIATSVRTNHVHVVLAAARAPGAVMNSLKSWATRRLREAGLLDEDTKPWERHGSTR